MPISSNPYPKFYTAMLRPAAVSINGKARFAVDFRGPLLVHQSYEFLRYSFYIPAQFLHAADSHNAAVGTKIHNILRACALDERTDCWHWVGQKNGSYPSTYFLGKPRGAMKVLMALLTGDGPESFQTRRLCNSTFCINPRHHRIISNYNIPVDPIFLAQSLGIIVAGDNKFWSHPQVLPWQRINGIETLTREEIAQLPIEEKKTFLPPLFSTQQEIKEMHASTRNSSSVAEDEKWRRVASGELAIALETVPVTAPEANPNDWIKDYDTVEKLEQLLKYLDDEDEIKLATKQLEILQLQKLEVENIKKKQKK